MGESGNSLKDEILLALSISLGALFFATALTLIIARYYRKIRSCCEPCCPSDNKSTSSTYNGKSSRLKHSDMQKEIVSNVQFGRQYLPAFLQSSENQFTIPGAFHPKSIQPQLKITPVTENHINSRTYSSSSKGSPFHDRRYTNSVASLPANFSPGAARRLLSPNSDMGSDDDAASLKSEERQSYSVEDMTSLDLKPELYNISRQRTMGIGSLGKVHLSLQYESSSRKKLAVSLNKLNKLQMTRPDIVRIYSSIVLLPERELIYTTKHEKFSPLAVFEETFIFASKPMNRDFDSKTILALVHYIDRSNKDIVYGEARLPLLCREIYSQVTTDVTLNIKVASTQNECGDILVQLIYNEPGSLYVMVKSVKMPSKVPPESISGLQSLYIKCYLKRLGNRVGKKAVLSKSLDGVAKHSFEIDSECKFKVPRDSFKDYDLTLAVSGKQKLIGKKIQLGKAVIGGSTKDETGLSHWNMLLQSPGIAWTVWHAIYNS